MYKVLAGIVSYNPDINRFRKNIKQVLEQVDKVVVFDNASRNFEEIKTLVDRTPNVVLINNQSNDGMATALNKIMEYAENQGYNWVLSLDQDSIIDKDMVQSFEKFINYENVGIICPFVIDSRRRYMRYEFKNDFDEVDMCITSGSMTSVEAWRMIARFDDWLFIDLVDNDFCKRLRLYEYKIVRVNKVLLNQEFGNIREKSDFWINFFVKLGKLLHNTNIQKFSYIKTVDPHRVYYTNRNIIYLNIKYKNNGGIGYENYHCKTYFGFMICFSFASLLRGREKGKIFNAIIKGIRDGNKKASEMVKFNINNTLGTEPDKVRTNL